MCRDMNNNAHNMLYKWLCDCFDIKGYKPCDMEITVNLLLFCFSY